MTRLPHLQVTLALLLTIAIACGRAAPPPSPPKVEATITQSTFEPVYRAAKAVQGATVAGIAFVKFGELLQGFSTEIGIAKDHDLNEADKKLLPLYAEAFSHYQLSAELWKMKIQANDAMWHGEIPFQFGTNEPDSDVTKAIALYHLPIANRVASFTGKK